MTTGNLDRCHISTQHRETFKGSTQADGIVNTDHENHSPTRDVDNGSGTAFSARVHGLSPIQNSKPRRPTSLSCCSPAVGDKFHNLVRRSCEMGVCPNTSLQQATPHEVHATNVKRSISSDSPEDTLSIRSNFILEAFNILDELSRPAPCTPPQRILAASEALSHIQGSRPGTQSTDAEALYIFSPRNVPAACYLYQPKESLSKDMYEVEQVPVEVVKTFGCSAYLIAVSDRDDKVGTLELEPSSRGATVEPISMMQTLKADWSPQNSPNRLSQRFQSADLQVKQRHDHSFQDVGPSTIRFIIDRVKDQLQARGQCRSSIGTTDEAGNHGTDSKGLYLINNDDVSAAVNTVAAGLDQTNAALWTSRSSSKVRSSSLSPPSLPRLDRRANSITPHLSAVADPATTFSVPRASFSSLGRVESCFFINQGLEKSARASVVSRPSVASFSWTRTQHPSREPGSESAAGTISRAVSDDNSTDDEPLAIRSAANTRLCKTEIDTTDSSLHQSAALEAFENFVGNVSAPRCGSQSIDAESTITSFPELRSRRCTQEWLSLPVDLDHLTRRPSADLYQLGVDAHSSGASPLPSDWLGKRLTKAQSCNYSSFKGDPFCYPKIHSSERRATESFALTPTETRLGAGIGSASHRRRSCQVPDPKASQHDPGDGLQQGVFDRLLKKGENMFHPHDGPEASDVPEAEPPARSPAIDCRSGAGPRSRDSIIRERTPQPPRPDASGIYEAMTGSRMLVHGKRRDVCSSDNRPHVCENDMDSSPRACSPS